MLANKTLALALARRENLFLHLASPLLEPAQVASCQDAVVRRGGIADLGHLLPIIRAEIPEKRDIGVSEVTARCISGCSIAVAERDKEVIGGVIMLHLKDSAYIWLGAFKEKGTGLGKACLKTLLEEAAKLGYGIATVKTSEDNLRAQSLLRGLGFEVSHKEGKLLVLEKQIVRKVLCL
jgi:ribosomal protein S18 acetylase RimI-like enzyme